jgi:hypothetical protein
MLHRLAFVFFLVFGCGSGQPAQSPESPAETEKSSAPTTPDEGAAPQAADASNANAAASSDDVRDVLQVVIDDEALTPYLHLEQPDRFPLRIAGRDLPQNLELTKGTKPVVIVDAASDDKKQPLLIFTEIEIKGSEANVRYRYDVEGIRGSVTLNKPHGRWELKRSRISER